VRAVGQAHNRVKKGDEVKHSAMARLRQAGNKRDIVAVMWNVVRIPLYTVIGYRFYVITQLSALCLCVAREGTVCAC